jgi:hypothetical protein
MREGADRRNRDADSFNLQGLERISAILQQAKKMQLGDLTIGRRNQLLGKLQDSLDEYFTGQPVRFSYDPAKSTWQSIHDLLHKAADGGKEGPVAQYLVGAKLQRRFPKMEISNESYSTADVQTRRRGDFHIGDTVFHVTVAPMPALYDKCKRNIDEGFKVYLLVPDRLVAGTKQNSELQAEGKISVESIESFVSQNIDELSGFSRSEVKRELRHLLESYNKRVDLVETNKSMMIEIPVNLSPSHS